MKTILFFVLLLSTACTSAEAQTRRALLVGIDDYTASRIPKPAASPKAVVPDRGLWKNLRGAVNDVQAMRGLLIGKYSFRPGDIKVITNQEASREAILNAIRDHLIAPARKGDEVLFFYAGHGSQAVNSLSSEPDRKDETIVPADSPRGMADIRDKELRRLFNQILDKEARLTVILDTCHSGSGARGLPSRAQARLVPLDPRDIKDGADAGPAPEGRGALILSASQDNELAGEAWDEAGNSHGAFTLALIEALGRSEARAPAEEVFLRTKARLQMDQSRRQEPVLAGPGSRREQPLFGSVPEPPGGSRAVAVGQVRADGTIVLQGGWANGLHEGNVLELKTQSQTAPIRIRITAVKGPAESEAKLQKNEVRAQTRPLESGDLFELTGWTVSSEPWLRVWIPEAGAHWETILRQTRELRSLAARSGVGWVLDPVEETPTHTLSWEKSGWMLIDPAGELESLGADPEPSTLLKKLSSARRPARLFVHLPAPPGLAGTLRLGAGTRNNAVQRTQSPENANYQLVGRWNQGTVEFAWILPAAGAQDRSRLPLPVRTDWHPQSAEETRSRLEDSALRIAKIRAWLTLNSPPRDEFPYRLILKDSRSRSVAPRALLPAQATYGLALTARPQDLTHSFRPRYIYVFTINSQGASVLLFPPRVRGNVENRFPLLEEGRTSLPTEIPLGEQPSFRISEPYGIDSYFLLTTETPIADPDVLQFAGIRTRGPKGRTPLEELLSQTGGTTRGDPSPTPVTWSIEWQAFESKDGL